MHDRDFLKGRPLCDSSTCEPGFRHTAGWLALLASSRLPARSHSNFSTGVTSLLCTRHAAAATSACNTLQLVAAHRNATLRVSSLHYVATYNRRVHHRLRYPSTCATVCSDVRSRCQRFYPRSFSIVFPSSQANQPDRDTLKVIQLVSAKLLALPFCLFSFFFQMGRGKWYGSRILFSVVLLVLYTHYGVTGMQIRYPRFHNSYEIRTI